MNFDFLVSQQNLPQKNQLDFLSKPESAKKHTSQDKDAFQTTQVKKHAVTYKNKEDTVKDAHFVSQNGKEISFSELMDMLQQAAAVRETKAEAEVKPETVSKTELPLLTPVSAIEAPNDIQTETDETLSKIAALNTEILALLEAARQSVNESEKPVTLTIEAPETETPKNILEMFSFILNQVEEGKTDLNANDQLTLLENMKKVLSNDDITRLLTTNQTPEQITDLKAVIDKMLLQETESDDNKPLIEAFASLLITLTPPTEKTVQQVQAKAENIAINETKSTIVQPESTQPSATVPAPAHEKHFTQTRYDARYDQAQSSADADVTPDTDFQAALKDADIKAPALKVSNDNAPAQSASQRFLQNAGLDTMGSTLTSSTQATAAVTAQTNTPYQATLTNVVTQAHSASYPHPATQTVMATIQKAIKAGDDTTIKLQLDPPELGRVEVKMSFNKDNTKVVLTAEKPETLVLLQRDAPALDRALQNAGLDTQANLSFELASDNQNFGHNNNRGGTHAQGGKGASAAQAEDIIETTMDWKIDPRTGVMHYNVLV